MKSDITSFVWAKLGLLMVNSVETSDPNAKQVTYVFHSISSAVKMLTKVVKQVFNRSTGNRQDTVGVLDDDVTSHRTYQHT